MSYDYYIDKLESQVAQYRNRYEMIYTQPPYDIEKIVSDHPNKRWEKQMSKVIRYIEKIKNGDVKIDQVKNKYYKFQLMFNKMDFEMKKMEAWIKMEAEGSYK